MRTVAAKRSQPRFPLSEASRGQPHVPHHRRPGSGLGRVGLRRALSTPAGPDVDNPCTPAIEAIDLEGIIHGQGSLWDNDHFKSHYGVNVTGVDADNVRYQGSSTGNGKGEFLGSETEDVVISTVITSQGGLPNFVSKIVLHHHKDGSITVDRSGEECRG